MDFIDGAPLLGLPASGKAILASGKATLVRTLAPGPHPGPAAAGAAGMEPPARAPGARGGDPGDCRRPGTTAMLFLVSHRLFCCLSTLLARNPYHCRA